MIMATIVERLKRARGRLGTRVIAWSFVPTAIILTAVALVNLQAYRRVTEHLVLQRDRELARLSAGQVAAELAGYADVLRWMATSPDLCAGDSEARRVALVSARGRLSVFDGGVVALDDRGVVVAADPARPEILGQDWSDRAHVAAALGPVGATAYSDIVPDGRGGAEVIVLAVPLSTYESPRGGVLAGMLAIEPDDDTTIYGGLRRGFGRWANLPEEIYYVDRSGRLSPPPSGALGLSQVLREPRLVGERLGGESVFLVDRGGRVIYHSDPARIGEDVSSLASVRGALEGRVGAARMVGQDGEAIVASYAPVPGTGWGLISEVSWRALIAPGETYRRFLLALLGAGLVVPAVVVTWRVRGLMRPVAELGRAAQEVAEGRFGRQVDVRTGDELEDLAARFNAMSAQLQGSYASLEQRVADRTRELETLNAVAATVSRTLDLRRILGDALEVTLRFAAMDAGEAYEVGGEGEAPELRVRRGAPGTSAGGAHLRADGDVARALTTGRPVVTDLSAEGEAALRHLAEGGMRMAIIVPLMAHDEPVGLMVLAAREARAVAEGELALLGSIGRQVGVAVENARLYLQARTSATLAERNRLARDLHDSVTQTLYGLTLYAKAASRLLRGGRTDLAAEHLAEAEAAAQQALREMRLLIYELRPPALVGEGLAAALRGRLEAVEGRAGLDAHLVVEGDGCPSPEVEEALYHLAQEALNNALKHSRARSVQLRLMLGPDRTALTIRDDGVGFRPEEARGGGGLGLHSMQERAARVGGRLQIDSRRGEGTTIHVEVPT